MGIVLEAGVPVPANVIEAGKNDIVEYMEDEVGGILPGQLLMRGTLENQVVLYVAGSWTSSGIAGLNQYAERLNPGTGKTTATTAGQMIPVIRTGYVVLLSDPAGGGTTVSIPQRCINTNGYVEDNAQTTVAGAFNQANLALMFLEHETRIGHPMNTVLANEEFVCHLSKW